MGKTSWTTASRQGCTSAGQSSVAGGACVEREPCVALHGSNSTPTWEEQAREAWQR